MLKLSYLEEYIDLAESLNFSKTAEKMFITQPVLSRHIAKLEEEMGCKLLERSTRSVVLTPAGEVTYEAFRNMVLEFYTAKKQVAYLSAGKTGQIKISSPYYLTEDFAEPIVTEFMDIYPDTDVSIFSCQPAEGLESILNGESDILISLYTEDIDEELRRVPFAYERFAVICMKDHPLASHSTLTYEDLRDVQNLQLVDFGSHVDLYSKVHGEMMRILTKHSVYINDFFFSEQVDTLGIVLKKTNGISILPYCLRNMNRSYLKVIPLTGEDTQIPMCIYYRADNKNILIPKFVQLSQQIDWQLQ